MLRNIARRVSGKGIFILLLFFFLLNLVWKLVQANSFAPDLGGFERNVIWAIQRLMDSGLLYTNPDAEPFPIVQYMPLFYYLMASLGNLLGILPEDAHAVYQVARFFNFGISAGIAVLIFYQLRVCFRAELAVSLGVALLSFIMMPLFTISGRPDILKSFFFLLQVCILFSARNLRLRFLIPLASVLSWFCFMSKQDGLVSFGILPLCFLFAGEWRRFFISGLIALITISASLFFFQIQTDGWFFANAVDGLRNGISISWFKSVFFSFFSQYGVLFAPALVLSLEFAQEKDFRFRVLAAAFLLAFFPPLAASLKFGSGSNYFLEAVLLALLMLTLALMKWKSWFFRFEESKVHLFLMMVLLWFAVPSLDWASGIFLNQEANLQRQYQLDKEMASSLRVQFPTAKFILLTERQWEDNLTTLLFDCIANPNRDVSAQVYAGNGGNALRDLKQFVLSGKQIVVITDPGRKPQFPGLDFSDYRQGPVLKGYHTWQKSDLLK